ncbi:hypothetical protein CTI14_72040, partial [Methylobacterium radiotolerans]
LGPGKCAARSFLPASSGKATLQAAVTRGLSYATERRLGPGKCAARSFLPASSGKATLQAAVTRGLSYAT